MGFMSIIGKLLYETALRVAWKAVAERFITRFTVWGLRKLASSTKNTLDDKTVDDIVESLKGKKLKVIDDI